MRRRTRSERVSWLEDEVRMRSKRMSQLEDEVRMRKKRVECRVSS